MPTYEYACNSCQRRFEVVQSFSDETLTKCDECGGELRRVPHPVGVLFKGSGFYSTDSRTKSKAATDGKPKKSEDKKEASSSKSDSSSGDSSSNSKSSDSSSSSDKKSDSTSSKEK